MSLTIPGIGAVPPIFAQSGGLPAYAQNEVATLSAGATTLAAELGAAAVVYEAGQSDPGEPLTYSNPDPAGRLPVAAVATPDADAAPAVGYAGDEAIVAATSGDVAPAVPLPQAPFSAAIEPPARGDPAVLAPAAPDAAPLAYAAQPPQVGQAEAHAQASYAAVAEAMIVGASLADLPKYA